MGEWINRKEGWLNGHIKSKPAPIIPSPIQDIQNPESQIQVIIKIRCPKCKRDKVKQYGRKGGNILYYRCINCKTPFKVIEKDPNLSLIKV